MLSAGFFFERYEGQFGNFCWICPLFHISVFKLFVFQFPFPTIICVIGMVNYSLQNAYHIQRILLSSTIFHPGGFYFSIFSEIRGKFFCIFYLALVKPDLQLGTQHLLPMIGIQQHIKLFSHKQCK